MTDNNTAPKNFLDDCHQRITRLNSEMGWEHLTNTPEKIAQHDKEANAIANVSFVRLSELDSNPLAQAVAGEIMKELLRDNHEPHTDIRWCEDTFLRAGIYSTERQECIWVNIERFDQWVEVAAAYPDSVCQVHSHPDCRFFNDDGPRSDELNPECVKRGENVAIFYSCAKCRERMDNHSWTAEGYVQRGPLPWIDQGPIAADPEDPFLS